MKERFSKILTTLRRSFVYPFLLFLALLTAGIATAAWSGPPAGTPPNNCTTGYAGCDAPLSTSGTMQFKTGGLTVGSGAVGTGLIVANGNVGIGTTNPGVYGPSYTVPAQLTINGGNNTGFGVFVGSGNIGIPTGGIAVQGTNDGSGGGYTAFSRNDIGNFSSNYVALDYATNSNVGFLATGKSLAFQTGNASRASGYDSSKTRMVIDTSGNVGIGTVSPSAKLDVNGTIKLPSDTVYGKLDIGGFGAYISRQASDGSTIIQAGQASLLLNPTGNNPVVLGSANAGASFNQTGPAASWAQIVNWPPGSGMGYGILVGTGLGKYSQFQNTEGYWTQLSNGTYGVNTNGNISASGAVNAVSFNTNAGSQYASNGDVYMTYLGRWQSGTYCRYDGTNCPAAAALPGNMTKWDTWYGSGYLASNGDLYMGFRSQWLSTFVANTCQSNGTGCPPGTAGYAFGGIYGTQDGGTVCRKTNDFSGTCGCPGWAPYPHQGFTSGNFLHDSNNGNHAYEVYYCSNN